MYYTQVFAIAGNDGKFVASKGHRTRTAAIAHAKSLRDMFEDDGLTISPGCGGDRRYTWVATDKFGTEYHITWWYGGGLRLGDINIYHGRVVSPS